MSSDFSPFERLDATRGTLAAVLDIMGTKLDADLERIQRNDSPEVQPSARRVAAHNRANEFIEKLEDARARERAAAEAEPEAVRICLQEAERRIRPRPTPENGAAAARHLQNLDAIAATDRGKPISTQTSEGMEFAGLEQIKTILNEAIEANDGIVIEAARQLMVRSRSDRSAAGQVLSAALEERIGQWEQAQLSDIEKAAHTYQPGDRLRPMSLTGTVDQLLPGLDDGHLKDRLTAVVNGTPPPPPPEPPKPFDRESIADKLRRGASDISTEDLIAFTRDS